jgi:Icc protein
VDCGLWFSKTDPMPLKSQAMQKKAPDNTVSNAFRLLQISDCHLSASAESSYRGQNPDAGLRALSNRIAAWQPQLVLATGDLSEDASAASYQRLADYLVPIGAPVCALPGNHDDDGLMRRYFQQGPWNGPLVLTAGDWQLVLLKTSSAGRIDGVISQADVRQLRQMLRSGPGRPVLLALHHHPVPAGSPWIDRHMLESPGPLLDLISNQDQIRGVVWGHVHQALESTCGHARMLACPSTAANSRPGTLRFEHDPAGPACRWLLLSSRGTLETGLLYGNS